MKNIYKTFIFIFLILISINVKGLEKVEFNRCVDGDTAVFKLNGEKVKIRFIGINTPESVKENSEVEYYGKEASEFTCNLLTNAKNIEIEYEENSDKYDKYGRMLAYVYIDSEMIEYKLLENGYAEVKYIYGDYKYTDELYKYEKIARDNKIGIWSEEKEENIEKKDDNEEKTLTFFEKLLNFIKKIVNIFL